MQNAGLSPPNQVISFGDVLRWLRPVRWALAIGATVGALSGWVFHRSFAQSIARKQR